MREPVFLVVTDGPLVLGVYVLEAHAQIHARMVTGATVVLAEIHTRLPDILLDELAAEHAEDFDGDTPVTQPALKLPK